MDPFLQKNDILVNFPSSPAPKLVVKVVRAHKLFPEHSQDSAGAFVVLTFDGQQFRTSSKFKDVSPAWNESFYFDMSDPYNLDKLVLECSVYGVNKSVQNSRPLLGKVRLCVSPDSEDHVMYYPLQKNWVFSPEARGVLALKVCITTNEASMRAQEPQNTSLLSPQLSSAMRLCVQVVSAHGLMPMDEQGSASTYVELSFDYYQYCTAVKEKDLNPLWNEGFYFNVWDPSSLPTLVLEACVYNVNKSIKGSKSFLGVVRLNSYSFMSYSDDAPTSYHPLQRSGMFSPHVTGGLRLRVYITSEPPSEAPSRTEFAQLDVSNFNESALQNQSSTPHTVSFQVLKQITNNFSTDRILGQGGFGVVYKGELESGDMIAVKKIVSPWKRGSEKQFQNEVAHLMMLKHPNIVRLLSYCHETLCEYRRHNGRWVLVEDDEWLLCLEYLPKGSLDRYLSDESSGFDWSTRYNIIEGISYGLYHLHEQIDKSITHLDLKPANILLDDRMVPKITDFGMSRLLDQQQTICTKSHAGTLGYMPPEFFHGGTITPKSDIFSLGVIIIEIITGRKPGGSSDDVELTLKKWRNVLQRSQRHGSVDMDWEQIKRCMQVGLMCVNLDRTKRPPIMDVINMLQGFKTIDSNVIANATQQH